MLIKGVMNPPDDLVFLFVLAFDPGFLQRKSRKVGATDMTMLAFIPSIMQARS